MLLKTMTLWLRIIAREKLFLGLSVFRRHHSPSHRQWFLKVDCRAPALGSRGVLTETEGFDHNLPSQSNKLLL